MPKLQFAVVREDPAVGDLAHAATPVRPLTLHRP